MDILDNHSTNFGRDLHTIRQREGRRPQWLSPFLDDGNLLNAENEHQNFFFPGICEIIGKLPGGRTVTRLAGASVQNGQRSVDSSPLF
jgi:hypothetical protein